MQINPFNRSIGVRQESNKQANWVIRSNSATSRRWIAFLSTSVCALAFAGLNVLSHINTAQDVIKGRCIKQRLQQQQIERGRRYIIIQTLVRIGRIGRKSELGQSYALLLQINCSFWSSCASSLPSAIRMKIWHTARIFSAGIIFTQGGRHLYNISKTGILTKGQPYVLWIHFVTFGCNSIQHRPWWV